MEHLPTYRKPLRLLMMLLILSAVIIINPLIGIAPTFPVEMYSMESSIYAPLMEKLSRDGYSSDILTKFYRPGRDVFYERLTRINLVQRDYASPYKRMYNDQAVQSIREFTEANASLFDAVWDHFRISPGIIGAILYVESRFGESSGDHPVLYVLSSMTLAPEEWNMQKLIDDMDRKFPEMTEYERTEKIRYLRRRARTKSEWAYRELTHLLDIHQNQTLDIYTLKGSWAGAFGIPQFMPSSYTAYAVDGNDNGKIDITTIPDAIASVANYLYKNGWRGNLTESKKRKAIWRYNHSHHYVNLILKLARAVET